MMYPSEIAQAQHYGSCPYCSVENPFARAYAVHDCPDRFWCPTCHEVLDLREVA